MNNGDLNRKYPKLLVCLFSDPNFLALNLLENLLANNCTVNIISDYETEWIHKTERLADRAKFSVTTLNNYKKITNFSYAIFCGGFISKQKGISDFKQFISNKNFGSAKTLAVFPFESFSLKTSSKINMSDNGGIIYLGDLLGPRIDLESNLLIPSLIKEMIEKRTLTLGIGELFFPVFAPDAAKIITKWLLSFGPYGKETFLLGPQTSTRDFWKQNMKSFPDLRVLYDTEIETRYIPKGYEIKRVGTNLGDVLAETYHWIIQDKIAVKKEKPKKVIRVKPKNKRPSRLRLMRPFLLPLFLILFFPALTLLISSGLLFLSYKQFLADRIQSSQKSALFAKTIFVIGKAESDVLSNLPLAGRVYKETSYISYLGASFSDVFTNTIPLSQTAKLMVNNVLGTGIYDATAPSLQLKSGLDYLYQQISLVQIATKQSADKNILSAKQVLNIVDFDKFKKLTQQGSALVNKLPLILGTDSNKNYLILFENNMELRPTGGFVGSYGIADLGGGKLNGLTVNDIYSADGQLKGHIEPPAPIKTYLGEANWWFRDSNWDSDFPTSAQRAEWFLGKEMEQQVDGVIAIDLEPIKNILKYTGPIFLPDYNLTITADNLYEKTQEEAQANFFPGSRKKASFLTALSRVLLSEISKMDSKQRLGVLKVVYDGMEGRHIQIYMHDQDFQSAIDKLGWDGKLPVYSCGTDCYSDFFGDVEANVGVNKSNYFIKRSMNFSVSIDSKKITRDLKINISNGANPSLGPSAQYKTYLRILVPSDSQINGVKTISGQSEIGLIPDITQEEGREEAGVYVEITPGESKTVDFSWSGSVPSDSGLNSYGLFVRKQAGTGNDALSVQLSGPITVLNSVPVFSLTKAGIYTYNTILGKDFFARLSWKQLYE